MTDTLRIELDGGMTNFRPGDAIRGSVSWAVAEPIESVKVCLVWFTEGKGTRDLAMVQDIAISSSRAVDRQSFELTAPLDGPYSFSGKLISLVWAVELLVEPGNQSVRQNIVISPSGTEIDLHSGAADESA